MHPNAIRDVLARRRNIFAGSAVALFTILLAFPLVKWCQGPAAAQAAPRVSYPRELSRVTFAAAGDVIPHQAVAQSAAAHSLAATPAPPAAASDATDGAVAPPATAGNHAGWDVLFAAVADVFRQADFGFVNLETPVAPKHTRGSKPFQFDAPIALLQALKFSGIKIVSFANNHVFDQGHIGFAESLDHLREQDLLFTGAGATADAAWKPVVLEKNGIKVGWLGMTRWLNGSHNPEKDGDPHVAFFPYPGEANGAPGLTEAQVLDAVKAARAQCDFLLISIHWGVEYATAPRDEDVEMAHKMLEAGAGAVLGHHPHVLQPIETYITQDQRHAVVLYSLGNFLSNQSRNYVQGLTPEKAGEERDSLIVRFSVIKRDYGPAGIRIELGDMGILPVWTENNHLLARAGHDKTLLIRPVLMDREIPRLQARFDELDHLGPQLNAGQKQELVQISRQLQLLKRRRELLLARTGDDYLIAPPNP